MFMIMIAIDIYFPHAIDRFRQVFYLLISFCNLLNAVIRSQYTIPTTILSSIGLEIEITTDSAHYLLYTHN